jgi:hypothetical protein
MTPLTGASQPVLRTALFPDAMAALEECRHLPSLKHLVLEQAPWYHWRKTQEGLRSQQADARRARMLATPGLSREVLSHWTTALNPVAGAVSTANPAFRDNRVPNSKWEPAMRARLGLKVWIPPAAAGAPPSTCVGGRDGHGGGPGTCKGTRNDPHGRHAQNCTILKGQRTRAHDQVVRVIADICSKAGYKADTEPGVKAMKWTLRVQPAGAIAPPPNQRRGDVVISKPNGERKLLEVTVRSTTSTEVMSGDVTKAGRAAAAGYDEKHHKYHGTYDIPEGQLVILSAETAGFLDPRFDEFLTRVAKEAARRALERTKLTGVPSAASMAGVMKRRFVERLAVTLFNSAGELMNQYVATRWVPGRRASAAPAAPPSS